MCLKIYSKHIFQHLRIPSSITNNAKTNKLLMRPISAAPKSVSNKMSTINTMMKKRSESSMTNLVTIPLSKTMSDTHFRTCTKNEKPLPQKKDIKNVSSTLNMNEKNVKKDLIKSKTIKQEIGSVAKCDKISDKQINRLKLEKYSNKIDNINMKSTSSIQENKLKSKTQIASKTSISKNIVGNIKSSPVLTQNSHSKTRSKVKSKPKKKVIATNNKSEIFNTDKALFKEPLTVGDGNFDLADLIEASLKNIRSPRSIFDYDFSYVQQANRTRDILDIRKEIQNIDKIKQLKPGSSVIANNFSNKIIRSDRILEKLSEKSESFSEASNESFVNDKKSLPEEDNKPFSLSEKYIKARAELQKSLDWRRSDTISFQDRWNLNPDINFQNKSFISPRKVDNSGEKSSISKSPSKTSFLKAYTSNDLESRKKNSCEKLLKMPKEIK